MDRLLTVLCAVVVHLLQSIYAVIIHVMVVPQVPLDLVNNIATILVLDLGEAVMLMQHGPQVHGVLALALVKVYKRER